MSTLQQQNFPAQQQNVTFPSTEKLAVQEHVSKASMDPMLNQQQQQQQWKGEGFGTIQLKPICIEQEPISFRPGPITIQQPPLVVQGETITLPQPPIVIHPEPIVIPQAPLVFTPQAITMQRPPITVQPDAVTLARPSYSVQPIIQYDLRGCNKFGMPDFSQHVRVRLTNEQAGLNPAALGSGSMMSGSGNNYSSAPLNTGSTVGSTSYNTAPLNTNSAAPVHSDVFARDRDYNYGLAPSKTDKLKDSLGVANLGPQKSAPTVL